VHRTARRLPDASSNPAAVAGRLACRTTPIGGT
jgi:hypothetical protein